MPLSAPGGSRYTLFRMTPRRGDDGKGTILVLASTCFSLSVMLWALQLKRRTTFAEANALLDPLTGLFNRRGWEALTAREAARSQRGQTSMTIFVMDVDDFKLVNDRYGHARGDAILQNVAAAIRSVARVHDVVARLGGDEFSLLAIEDGSIFVDAIVARLEAALQPVGVSVSIGHATVTSGSDVLAATAAADRLMYINKVARRVGRVTDIPLARGVETSQVSN
jgi:diguanylate cyclase